MDMYAKAVLATIIAVATALVTALGTSPQQSLSNFDTKDWLTIIGAILASGAIVWWTENVPGLAGGIIKAVVASVGAFCTALITAYADNIVTQAELIGAVSAGLVALAAIYQVTNSARTTA
jgi:hypothetical protein